MKRIILVAAVVLALVIAGVAQAKGGKGGHSGHGGKGGKSHAKDHAKDRAKPKDHGKSKDHKSKPNTTTRTGAKARNTSRATNPKNYHRTNGVRFPGGTYYAGKNHNHWSSSTFSSQYNTTIYQDPGLNVWYYWDDAAGRYYPVSSRK